MKPACTPLQRKSCTRSDSGCSPRQQMKPACTPLQWKSCTRNDSGCSPQQPAATGKLHSGRTQLQPTVQPTLQLQPTVQPTMQLQPTVQPAVQPTVPLPAAVQPPEQLQPTVQPPEQLQPTVQRHGGRAACRAACRRLLCSCSLLRGATAASQPAALGRRPLAGRHRAIGAALAGPPASLPCCRTGRCCGTGDWRVCRTPVRLHTLPCRAKQPRLSCSVSVLQCLSRPSASRSTQVQPGHKQFGESNAGKGGTCCCCRPCSMENMAIACFCSPCVSLHACP